MRIPRAELRKRLLPQRVLDKALPEMITYSRNVAEFFGCDPEDIEEGAVIGTWFAWETFDPANGSRWPTWLKRNVNWCIGDAMRNWGKDRNKDVQEFRSQFSMQSLSEPVGFGDDDTGITLEDTVADPRSDFATEIADRLHGDYLLSRMLPRERKVFEGRYRQEALKREVAADMGISPSRVSQLEDDGRRRAIGQLEEWETLAGCPVAFPVLSE